MGQGRPRGVGGGLVLEDLHPHVGVIPRQRHPPPNEGQERVRQPIEPAQILRGLPTLELQVQPHVQELVGAQPGHAVHLEGVRTEVLPPNVEVALERRDAAEEALFLPPEPAPAAYVCLGATCSAPITDPATLPETIEKMRSSGIQTLE